MNRVAGLAAKAALAYHRRRLWPLLRTRAGDPASAQRRTLLGILDQHASTSFGRAHSFAEVRDGGDYAAAVPVHDYEDLRPFIAEQQRTGESVLTDEAPILFARTSGTTGQPKDIPVTASGLRRQAKAQRLLATMITRSTRVLGGRFLTVGSPAIEGHLPSGTPYGSASGMILDAMPALMRRRYLITQEISAVTDHDERYRAIALEGLAEREVTAIGSANPSTFLRIRDAMRDDWESLLVDVGRRRLTRARELSRLDPHQLHLGDVWPDLATITTWTGGSCAVALDRLRPWLPPTAELVELGYTASELRGTVAPAPGRADCVPLLDDVYFEFVARSTWEDGGSDFQGLESLEVGAQYYVFITTVDGLYRYDMNDILEVVGRYEETPTLAFVQKGRGVTTITGEKLYESQLIDALRAVGSGSVPGAGFFLALADRERSTYDLYIEGPVYVDGSRASESELAIRVDDEISHRSVEYQAKRASKRLGPIEVHELTPGAGDRYRETCVARGQREAQFKILHLQYRDQCPVPMAAIIGDKRS